MGRLTNLVALCDFCLMQHFIATGVEERKKIREIIPGVQSECFFFSTDPSAQQITGVCNKTVAACWRGQDERFCRAQVSPS